VKESSDVATANPGATAFTDGRLAERQVLHHYTSIHGVRGILDTNSIWASLLHFMNDSREWLYTLELVHENLNRRLSQRHDRQWPVFIAHLIQSLQRIVHANIFIASFSEVPNQLSQWRAYCPPEGGYAINFDKEFLEAHLTRQEFQLRPCIYDVGGQKDIVHAVVGAQVDGIGPLDTEEAATNASNDVLYPLGMNLATAAPMLKHPDFREEKEWRAFALLPGDDPRMKYHIRGSIVIPHCVVAIEARDIPQPILQVMVGPNAHQELAIRGLKALTVNTQIGVTASNTPLRKF
jgi:hypothetical protein